MSERPRIGVTCDVPATDAGARPVYSAGASYAQCLAHAGATPMLLPPIVELIEAHLEMCDAIVFTGGGDPRMEDFGAPTHPKASVMDPTRQAYELALLRALETTRPDAPVLGICLGMQLMSLAAGGKLNQHLPDSLPTHADHWGREHTVRPEGDAGPLALREGLGASHHRQAITDAGRLNIIARSHDGIIEGVCDPSRPFYVGVQWHPERTTEPMLGAGIFRSLVRAAIER